MTITGRLAAVHLFPVSAGINRLVRYKIPRFAAVPRECGD